MAMVYYLLIKKNLKTIDEGPEILRSKVQELLDNDENI